MSAPGEEGRLQGLDEVDWGDVHGAYGPVPDMPRWLRSLDASRTTADAEAWDDLFQAVLHQGSTYEATAPTLPFLAEVAAGSPQATTALRVDLVFLIGTAAAWATLVDGDGDPPDTAVAARQAAASSLPALVPLVESGDPALVLAVGFAAAAAGVSSEPVARALADLPAELLGPVLEACRDVLVRRCEGHPASDADLERLGAAAPDALADLEEDEEDRTVDQRCLDALDLLLEPEVASLLRARG